MKCGKIKAFFVVLFLYGCLLVTVQSQQLQFARVDTLQDAIKYLVRFGYLKDVKEVASLLTASATTIMRDLFNPTASNPAITALKVALSAFQQYARLPQTGNFDEPTKKKMNSPRCGNKDLVQVPDISAIALRKREKRYAVSGASWHRLRLTYRVSRYSESGFHPTTTSREVDQAFQLWANYTNLEFVRADSLTDDVDIELKFARQAHGDVEPFDGRGIILAHAFPPGLGIGGDIHFDDDEDWTSRDYSGTNFYHVMVHELGHALGLRHSDIEEAIMYAFTRPYNPRFKLHDDDIEGIQSIYGEKGKLPEQTTKYPIITNETSTVSDKESTTKTPMPEDNSKPNLCTDSKLDAITTLEDGRIYAFKGSWAFRIDPNGAGVMNRYTEQIRYVFYGAPGHLDAAATYRGKTYLFKDDMYWRFKNRKIDGDFPRKISEDFPGIPDNLDAAFAWSGDDSLYFFKGDKYWGYNPDDYPEVAANYPLAISQWYGLPSKEIDAAFKSPDGPTYFFKDDNYWLFDDENFQVAEADPPYPRSSKVMWLACTSYRPGEDELRHGWVRRTLKKIKNAIRGHFNYKIQYIRGLFS